jgi:hypothetical protein
VVPASEVMLDDVSCHWDEARAVLAPAVAAGVERARGTSLIALVGNSRALKESTGWRGLHVRSKVTGVIARERQSILIETG